MEDKMKVKVFELMMLVSASLPTFGQNVLTVEANAMRDSDKLVYQQMESCYPGGTGEGEVWDFSSIADTEGTSEMTITKDAYSHFHKIEGQEKFSYRLNSGILEQYKKENRLSKIAYFGKKVTLKYPFQYGDSLCSEFVGYGTYCGDHSVKVKGKVAIQADGLGKLILSERDTLDNVLRVHTQTTTLMAMDVNYAEIDSIHPKQEIEDKYEWYYKGFRYPVCIVIQKSSYDISTPIGSSFLAYRILPEQFSQISDAVNEKLKYAGKTRKDIDVSKHPNSFRYDVANVEGRVDISYGTDTDANVMIALSNSSGVLYKKQSYTVKAGETGIFHIETSGLFLGQYVLYVNVNGKLYNRTINVK